MRGFGSGSRRGDDPFGGRGPGDGSFGLHRGVHEFGDHGTAGTFRGDQGEAVHAAGSVAVSDFIAKVYGWMTVGLLVTGLVSLYTASSEALLAAIFGSPLMFILIIAQFALVVTISGMVKNLSAATAGLLFIVYSALNGLTLSVIFLIYTAESLASTFVLCSATFGVMSVYGYTTKKDLSSLGGLFLMGLVGLIMASLVNIFLMSPAIYWLTTYAGILIFVGLVAYDTNMLKQIAMHGFRDEEARSRLAIHGALRLYLDFINLFIYLLRAFGDRR